MARSRAFARRVMIVRYIVAFWLGRLRRLIIIRGTVSSSSQKTDRRDPEHHHPSGYEDERFPPCQDLLPGLPVLVVACCFTLLVCYLSLVLLTMASPSGPPGGGGKLSYIPEPHERVSVVDFLNLSKRRRKRRKRRRGDDGCL